MRSSSHIRVWTCAAASFRVATDALAVRSYTSTRRHFSTEAQEQEDFTVGAHRAAMATPSPSSSSSSSPSSPPQRYRRRSSDPQTVREKGDFRRDYKYAKHRPLPDAPWRQLKGKTYLDDAERLYGRKETWHNVEDAVLREKLVAILQDYLRDTLAAARLEAKDARRYHHACATAAKQYRAHISSGAFGLVAEMQAWAQDVLRGRLSATALGTEANDESGGGVTDASPAVADHTAARRADEEASATAASSEERAAAEFREERRRRGAQAVLGNTAAMADVPDADARHTPQSAFPFLRRRAVEDEATLDPSLVDWTAKYFPEDDARTFAEPPKLRTRAPQAEGSEGVGSDGEREALSADGRVSDAAFAGTEGQAAASPAPPLRRAGSVHARHRLQRTLRDHENRHRATFDAEGVYYKVRRQSDVEERAPRPQPVKASDVEAAGRRQEVVKVPWSVASKAMAQGYTSDTLRAKERLIRLTRGEDPETIP